MGMHEAAINSIANALRLIGFDVDNDPHFKETPERFVRYLIENGRNPTYKDHDCDKTFEDDICSNEDYGNGAIIHLDIPFSSICPHHLLPYRGHVAVAYTCLEESGRRMTPGFSKIARIVARNSKMAYTQESFTQAIVKDVGILPSVTSAATVVVAGHSCVAHRGVEAVGVKSITEGCFLWVPDGMMNALREWAMRK